MESFYIPRKRGKCLTNSFSTYFFIFNIVACNPGYKWNGHQCVICPQGSYTDTNNAEICYDCLPNHFTFQPGSTQCFECKTLINIKFLKLIKSFHSCKNQNVLFWAESLLIGHANFEQQLALNSN